MKLVADPEMENWLAQFIPNFDLFDWDTGNLTKILKHGVDKDKVESIFFQEEYVFAGRILEPKHSEWRGLILGMDRNKRHLSLIFTRRGEKLRPISCRSMRKEEVSIYHEKIGN